jgi:hypothetical protein
MKYNKKILSLLVFFVSIFSLLIWNYFKQSQIKEYSNRTMGKVIKFKSGGGGARYSISYVYYAAFAHSRAAVIQGSILLMFTCVIMWWSLTFIALLDPNRWIVETMDVFSDDVALFLLFGFNHAIYRRICYCCHLSISCMCFGGRGAIQDLQVQYQHPQQRNYASVEVDDSNASASSD